MGTCTVQKATTLSKYNNTDVMLPSLTYSRRMTALAVTSSSAPSTGTLFFSRLHDAQNSLSTEKQIDHSAISAIDVVTGNQTGPTSH